MNLASGLRVYETRKGEWFLARSETDATREVCALYGCDDAAAAIAAGVLQQDGPRVLDDEELLRQKLDIIDRTEADGLLSFGKFLAEATPSEPGFFVRL